MVMSEVDVVVRPRVRVTPGLVVTGLVVLAGSILTAFLSAVALFELARDGGAVTVSIPLDASVTTAIVDGWSGIDASPSGTALVPVVVSDLPTIAASELLAAQTISFVGYLLAGLVGVAVSVLLLARRLRWRLLAPVAVATGLVLAAATFVSQLLTKSAAETLSSIAQADLDTWTEPGFGSGWDQVPVAAWLLVAATGVLFATAGRLARDADGLV